MFEPELVQSPLSQSKEVGDQLVQIEIYKLENESQWTLEVVDEAGTSIIWSDAFDTDFLALNEASRTLEKEGLAAFDNAEEVPIPSKKKPTKKTNPKSSKLSKQFRELEEFLLSDAVCDDCMTLTELDGYLAAIIVCPEMIMPSEWIPIIWGNEEPVFDDIDQAQAISGAVMALYNDIIKQLDNDNYGPIFDYDERVDEMIWEIWIDGFFRAMALRLEAWDIVEECELHPTFSIFFRLYELATKTASGIAPMETDDQIYEIAPDIITNTVYEFHEYRKAKSINPFQAANQNTPKVGRNDPCPCGSGKKFKKCCLH